MRTLMTHLKGDRRLFGRGRFGDLDRALGRKPGFLSLIFDGRERLSVERFLATLDYLGVHVAEFFAKVFPLRQVPPPAIGYLPHRKEQVRTQTRLPFRQDLLEWGEKVEVGRGGSHFGQDPDALLVLKHVDLNAAYRLGKATLEGVVAVKPSRLSVDAAEALCRVLIIFADILRARGDRNTACDLLDLTFRLESRSPLLPVRAFAYRTAAYVLCDLGYLADAEMFADRAIRICVSAADLNGLGRSLYNRGLMVWRQADCHEASPLFESALHYIPEGDQVFRAAVLFALANASLELGDIDKTEQQLEKVEALLPAATGPLYAQLCLVRAEVASLREQRAEADQLFECAIEEFGRIESVDDIAYAHLRQVEHLLRRGGAREAVEVAKNLMPFAETVQQEGGSAIVLEVVRLALRGQLTAVVLEKSLSRWDRPWLYRRT